MYTMYTEMMNKIERAKEIYYFHICIFVRYMGKKNNNKIL